MRNLFLILAGLAGVGVVVAALVLRTPEHKAAMAPTPLAPALTDRINTVTSVEVRTRGTSFTARRRDDGSWVLENRGGYPVPIEKIRPLLVGLAQLELIEPKTARADLYPKLSVQDPDQAPAEPNQIEPRRVTLRDAAGSVMLDVIVGMPVYSPAAGVYVRRVDEPQSWLARGQLDVPTGVTGWVETKLLEIPRERVRSATVTRADGDVLRVWRDSPTAHAFAIENLPPGKELKYDTVGDTLGNALGYVSFEDVAPAEIIRRGTESPPTPEWIAEFRTFDGLVLVVEAFRVDDRVWCRFSPAFDASAAAPEESRPPALKSAEDVRREAEDLHARLAPWVFELAEWKRKALASRMRDMLKDTPPAPPPSMEGTTPLTPAPDTPTVPLPEFPPSEPSPPPS